VSLALSPGFLVNDPDHAPFGIAWLRGITPARTAVLLAFCFLLAMRGVGYRLIAEDYAGALWVLWDRGGRTFTCAVPMFILVIKAEAWTARSTPRARITGLMLAVVAGSLIYTALRLEIRILHANLASTASLWDLGIAYFTRSLLTGGFLTAILHYAVHERDVQLQLHRARVSRIETEQQLVESRLNLLRAQIEPHFLFNSLASVKRLCEKDMRKGRKLLVDLAGYLRAAAALAREREIRLGDEVALARTFLAIFQVRMGKRLQVRIEVPAELGRAMVPPLAVATLIENAIKHGIAPRASGGSLSISARRDGDFLLVDVGDDGVGFRSRSGTGVGLANVCARLETLFGKAGRLDLVANPGGGVTATLRLPHRIAEAA
jgi:signal transduction histidine kinase